MEVALEWGRYPDKTQPTEIRRLLVERRYREAFDLIEVAGELPPTDAMYFLHMGKAASLLHLAERTAYYHGQYEAGHDTVVPLFDQIEAVVRASSSVSEGMLSVIGFCSEARPHEDWGLFRALDFDGDVRHLADWLQTLLSRDRAPGAIDGLWFGLINPIYDGEATSDLYVAGGEDAAQEPDAWTETLTWSPSSDARSQVLDGIYEIAYGHGTEGLGNHAEHPLCLTYACLAVRWLVTSLPSSLLLGDAKQRVIEVGYDSGDFLRIGTLTPEGLAFPQGGMIT